MKKLWIILLAFCIAVLSGCTERQSVPEETAGSAGQTVEGQTGKKSDETRQPHVSVMGITFGRTEVTLRVGETVALRAQVTPDDATERGVHYSIEGENAERIIAYGDGFLTALAEGQAQLTARSVEDDYIARCRVTVLPAENQETKPTGKTEKTTEEPTVTPTAAETTAAETTEQTEVTPGGYETPDLTPIGNAPVIVIDAGHGFENSRKVLDVGAGEGTIYNELSEKRTGTGLYEADLNLQIALKVQQLLEARGCRVLMTRSGYVIEHLSITARAERIKNLGAGMLISIHANAAANPEAHGVRVYYNANEGFSKAKESRALAQAIMQSVREHCAVSFFTDYLSDGQSLAVLNGSGSIPSVLVETAFLTNEGDALLALDEGWQTAIAAAIVDGVAEYIKNS